MKKVCVVLPKKKKKLIILKERARKKMSDDDDIDFLMDDVGPSSTESNNNNHLMNLQAFINNNGESNTNTHAGSNNNKEGEGAFEGDCSSSSCSDNNNDNDIHNNNRGGGDDDDDEEEEEDEEQQDEDARQGGRGHNEYHYDYKTLRNDDEGDWTEGDIHVLIAKVQQLKVRFEKVSQEVVAHPLVWVPLNSSSALAKNVLQQNAYGSIYFVNGLAKIGHRLDTELKLLQKYIDDKQYSRAKCNNLAFLEIFVRLLEVEKGILFVAVALPLRAKKSDRAKSQTSVDVDMISRGGLRWIKIRGSSSRNLEVDAVYDFSGSDTDAAEDDDDDDDSEEEQEQGQEQETQQQQKKEILHPQDTPFTNMLARLSRCAAVSSTYSPPQLVATAATLRLPFNLRPETLMVCSEAPTKRTIKTLKRAAPNIKLVDSSFLNTSSPSNRPLDYKVECINFDVTAMVALCSDITNCKTYCDFPSNPVLQRQGQAERDGQLCIENFLTPVLSEFTEVLLPKETSTNTNTASTNSRVSQRVRSMILGSGLQIVRGRSEWGEKFWGPLTDNQEESLRNELPPTVEIEKPGSLYGKKKEKAALEHYCSDGNVKSIMPSNWIAAKGAVEEFAWIVETISGPTERLRAVWLLRRLQVVDTDAQPGLYDRLRTVLTVAAPNSNVIVNSPPPAASTTGKEKSGTATTTVSGNNAALKAPAVNDTDKNSSGVKPQPPSNNIKQRQLNVFSLGDATNSVTLSANKSFLHSVFECGQILLCSTHPARALTERKRLGTDIVPSKDMWREDNKPLRLRGKSKENLDDDDDSLNKI